MTFLKVLMAILVFGLFGVAAADYFVQHPPSEGATIYGFLRFTGPLIGTIAALVIALAGNWSNYRQQEKEVARKDAAAKARVQEVCNGLIRELEVNRALVSDMFMGLQTAHKLLEGTNVNLDDFKKAVRKLVEQNQSFAITRPVYERLGSVISDLPDYVIGAIVNNESELQFLEATLKASFDVEEWRRVQFIQFADDLTETLSNLEKRLQNYREALEQRTG